MPDSSAEPSPRLRILCVDDEPSIRDVIALRLRHDGHAVSVAGDGLAAYQMVGAATPPYDLIITDNLMPNLTGVGLAERLRAEGYRGAIVFFSSTLDAASVERLAHLRLTAAIEKGAPMADLLAAVGRVRPQ